MNIVMFSMSPLFEEKSMTGAQKQLKKVAMYLAEEGHDVTILCSMRDDADPFYWHDNLYVLPIYRFKQPFPEPYATPIYNIAAAIQDTGEYLAKADRFYSHDGGLIFPYVYQNIPTVISLRSIVLAEALQSGFLFQGDALILASEHSAQSWKHNFGRFFPGFADRIHVIHNGLDFDHYNPLAPTRIFTEVVPIVPGDHSIILYPHRPDETKGIRQTIEVVDLLVNQHEIEDLRVLFPKWIDTGLSADVRQFYKSLEDDIAERGLIDHFVFHDWVSDEMMPEYYSLGDVTFALGNYVETFGNTPYESIACGTPVIASRVGPYRDMLPDEVLVDYDNIKAIAEKAAALLKKEDVISDETMDWLHENFKQDDMVKAYADIILNAEKRPLLEYQFNPITDETRFVLAPWCYVTKHGIYHDFKGQYCELDDLTRLVSQHDEDGFTFEAASEKEIMEWYKEGFLVPIQEQGQ